MVIAERLVGRRNPSIQTTNIDQESNPMKRKYEWFSYLLHRLGIKTPGEIYSCQTESELLRVDFEKYLKRIYKDSGEAENKLKIAIDMLDRADDALRRLDTVGFWRFYSLARMWELHAARDFDSYQKECEKDSDLLGERLEDVLVEAARVLNADQLKTVKDLFSSEKRSIENVETGIQLVYDQCIEDTHHFLKRRVITTQFEFFVLSTVASLALIHYLVLLEGGDTLMSQTQLDPSGASSGVSSILLLATISLFGILGASVSSLLSLSDVLSGTRISQHVGDLRLAIGRLVVGAAGALVVYVFLLSAGQNMMVLSYGSVLMISFAAGFTERLLLNAVKSISGEGDEMNVADQKLTELSAQITQLEEKVNSLTSKNK